MKDKEEIIVVTARCTDVAASCGDIDKVPCTGCGEMTWLSNSWRGKKIDKIICVHCFKNSEKYKGSDCSANVTERCISDAVEWAKKNHCPERTRKEIREEMIRIMEEKMGRKIKIVE